MSVHRATPNCTAWIISIAVHVASPTDRALLHFALQSAFVRKQIPPISPSLAKIQSQGTRDAARQYFHTYRDEILSTRGTWIQAESS